MPRDKLKPTLPWLAALIVLLAAAFQLHDQGRSWWCSCGHFLFWTGSAWSSDTSQHLFDPYSFTHILHGLVLYGLLAWTVPRLSPPWRFWLAVIIESLWEVVENTNFVIQRYRETTAALGYEGDSVINSLGDVVACGLGFWLARALGFRRSVAAFILIEAVLLLTIRDSLLLNIVMLIYPIEAIKVWQGGH